MFERFTERARQVVVLAQDEARGLKHNYIGTEHLLLGLIREEEGIAARVLAELGIELAHVRQQIGATIGEGEEATSGQIPFTPRAKMVLELALREALSLGHNYIGTEHLLLGIAREDNGVASQILRDAGSDADAIRDAVIGALGGLPRQPTPLVATRGRRFRSRRTQRGRVWQAEALLVGWGMFGVAAGLGVLLGWLIWG